MSKRKRPTEIKVLVTSYGKGRNLCMRYYDPKTGKAVVESAGTKNRKEALKAAGKWEDDLRNGRYKPASKMTWEEFRLKYESEVIDVEMADSTAANNASILDAIERILSPDLLSHIDGEAIERLKRGLREEKTTRKVGDKTVEEVIRRSEETVRGHLRVLKAALKWAHKKKMLHEVPEIEITAANGSKGRAITLEEFERLLDKIDAVRPAQERPQWERFLWGLWWSGLRLDEAVNLTWDDPQKIHLDLDGEDSTITIPGCQKNGQHTVGPIVPEFFEFLDATAEADRKGLVFVLPVRTKDTVSKIITEIGRAAGVKVSPTKCASAHDCRRAFGFRWAMRVMPVLLQKLMRHANIDTTLKYYVGNDAKQMGKAVWQAFRANQATQEASHEIPVKPR